MAFEMGIIGVGWCGGIRAITAADNPQISKLHICDIKPDRLSEVVKLSKPASFTTDYREILTNPDIKMVMISTTPESTHYPICKDALLAGKHVLIEKPIAAQRHEADELIALAEKKGLVLTVGYSQRFNPRVAYIKKVVEDGTIGEPVTALSSRNLASDLGGRIQGRTKLSLATMEATHDLDFLLWVLAPRKPIRVYSQVAAKRIAMGTSNAPDHQWLMVTLDDGTTITVGAGAIMPPGHPQYCQTYMQIIGTEGALTIYDDRSEVTLNTVQHGIRYPMSTMPGEFVGHVFEGPMATETNYFIDCVARGKPVMVKPAEVRQVMEVYVAADISAERNEPVTLPRND